VADADAARSNLPKVSVAAVRLPRCFKFELFAFGPECRSLPSESVFAFVGIRIQAPIGSICW
jgi:hypothetical protein